MISASKLISLFKPPVGSRFVSDFAGRQSAKFYPRSFSVARNDVFLSLAPVNAKYEAREGGIYQLKRSGYFLLDFALLQTNPGGQNILSERAQFYLGIKNVSELLELNPLQRFNPANPQSLILENLPTLGKLSQSALGFSRNSKVVRISQLQSDHFEFIYMELTEDEEISSQKKAITLRRGELRVIQTLLEFGMPYMMGWDSLSRKQFFSGEGYRGSRRESPEEGDF